MIKILVISPTLTDDTQKLLNHNIIFFSIHRNESFLPTTIFATEFKNRDTFKSQNKEALWEQSNDEVA